MVDPPYSTVFSRAAVWIHRLTKRFGDFKAVDDVSFEMRRGEIFGLVGPNGSGKTTTLNMISGLLRPTQGRVEVAGWARCAAAAPASSTTTSRAA